MAEARTLVDQKSLAVPPEEFKSAVPQINPSSEVEQHGVKSSAFMARKKHEQSKMSSS